MKLLTGAEINVCFLVGCGLCNKTIARSLDVSDGTVKTHLSNIYRKLKFNRIGYVKRILLMKKVLCDEY